MPYRNRLSISNGSPSLSAVPRSVAAPRALAVLACAVVVAAGVGVMRTPLADGLLAQDASICHSVSFGDVKLLNPAVPRTPSRSLSLPAGPVTITSATSTDSYPERVSINQPSERWNVEFLNAAGAVVGVSASTPDLEDNVESASWRGSLGSVTLSEDAVALRAVHQSADASINSVTVSGITVCYLPASATSTTQPPTTQPATTQPPATQPSTTEPSTTEPPVTSAPTTQPATTSAPTTAPAPAPPTVSSPTSVPSSVTSSTSIQTTQTTPVSETTAPPPSGPTLVEETVAPPPKGPALKQPVTKTTGLAFTGANTLALLSAGGLLALGGFSLLLGRWTHEKSKSS